MALIRGVRSLHPCPTCLVHRDELSNLSLPFALRTTAGMQAVLREARELRTKKDRDELLKNFGLRDVEVSLAICLQ